MRYFFSRILILLLPVGAFCYLLWVDIAPSGERVIRVEAGEDSPFLDHFLPQDRLTGLKYNKDGEGYETLIKDPVYFSLHPPKTHFAQVELTVEFQSQDQPVLEVGPLVDPFARTFDLRPLQETTLDALPWAQKTDGDITVFARNGDVQSVQDFLGHLPDRSTIATYHASLPSLTLPDYAPLSHTQTLEVTLRGAHRYLTYVRDEPFYLRADWWDMNRTIGTDSGAIIVRNAAGEIVLSKEFSDDGNIRDDQTPGEQTVELFQEGLPEGVYSVELKATSDIFWHRFTTQQRYMTFTNQLYLGDEIGYLPHTRPVSFVTDAKQLTLETYHGDATQTVTYADQSVTITASHEPFEARISAQGPVAVQVPKGDLQIIGAGKFAFTPSMFFDPEPVRLSDGTDVDAQGIDYVVAQYHAPTLNGDWKVASATFDLADLIAADGSVSFALSAPGIAGRGGEVQIHAVTARFKKAPMNFASFLRAVRDRLPFGL